MPPGLVIEATSILSCDRRHDYFPALVINLFEWSDQSKGRASKFFTVEFSMLLKFTGWRRNASD